MCITVGKVSFEDWPCRLGAGQRGLSPRRPVVGLWPLSTCCSCNVIVAKGAEKVSSPGFLERLWRLLNPLLGIKILSNPGKEVRLACQTRVSGDVEVVTHPPINWHGEKFWN